VPPIGPILRPVTAGIRWGAKTAAAVAGAAWGLLDYEEELDPETEWRRFVLEFSRATPAGTSEDLAQIGFDVVNFTGDAFDFTWTPTDHNDVSQLLVAWWTSVKPVISNEFTLATIKAYRRRFRDPITSAERFEDTGPATYIDTVGVAGTSATNALPYQTAMSITFKTGIPKSWGRVYLPGLSEDAITAKGRWDAADITTVATASGVLLNALHDAKFPLVVASTQQDSVLGGSLLNVYAIQIDDIPDVQRRRRPKSAAIRTIVPVS